MTENDSSLEFIERLRRKAPEYLDLLTAETEAEFNVAFEALLGEAIAHLERNKRNFEQLDEEGLSGVLAGALSMPGLTVTQESNSNGHVDLVIEADHCSPPRMKFGEAKIYAGPEYHLKGLGQLLGRYMTGREGQGLLIVYVRKRNIAGLMSKLRKRMDAIRPHGQRGLTVPHKLKWSFISVHGHSCGEDLHVGHVGCNLYID